MNYRRSGVTLRRFTSKNQKAGSMTQSTRERNKTLVLQAFDLLFNKRDFATAEKYWSPHYIQHSAHISTAIRLQRRD